MSEAAAHHVDLHVGVRFRQIRKQRGLSQQAVAEALGLTFQQIQKYERGINRISASKLFEASQILQVDIRYFFEGLAPASEGVAAPDPLMALGRTPGGLDLAEAFSRMRPSLQRQILQLAKVMDD